MDLPKIVRFLLTREAFSGVGSSDAVLYVLKDLEPGMQIAAVEVNPPPAARSYPRSPTQIEPVHVWGNEGSDPGEFNEPRGLAVDSQGNIYVVDSKNHRVQKLAPDGRSLLTFGGAGEAPGKFKDPCGVAVGPDDSVYVADTWNHRIQKFDGNGGFLSEFRPESGFWGPRGVAVGADGRIYVTDTGNKRVVLFDAAGAELKTWGREGSEDGKFIEPVGVALNAAGDVVIADTGNRRVQVFDPDGAYRSKSKVYGWEEFYTEPYLAVIDGDLLVTDSHNHRFARYTMAGEFVDSWGKSGAGRGAFNRPIGIAVGPDGTAYVSDTFNHRIQVFSLTSPVS
jgi:DNA-binding beta-propeller fold protein YncE